jgi:hypothetical protein
MSDRDEQNQPVSSEDLVKRAREELFGHDEREDSRRDSDTRSSVTADDAASSIDPVEDYAEFLRSTTEEEAHEDGADHDVPAEGRGEAEPTAVAQAPSPVLDEEELERSWDAAPQPDDRRSWDPSWTPEEPPTGYGTDRPVGGPDPSVLPPQTGSRRDSPGGGRLGGWIIGLAIFGGIALFNFLDDTTAVAALQEGDCIRDPGLVEVIEDVEAVGCDEPHEVEVFAVIELPDADGAPYLGEELVYAGAMDRCLPRFAGYVGTPYEESVYWVDAWTPVEEGWDGGDRTVLCVIYEVSDGVDIKTTSFSAHDSGR